MKDGAEPLTGHPVIFIAYFKIIHVSNWSLYAPALALRFFSL